MIIKRLSLLIYTFTHFFIYSFVSAQAPKTYTSSEILLQLKKLNTVGAVLYIAAHPDDENTRLISYLANEKCLRTGYLSLTRGDGGQNLIGPEQGIELGVIRTQELLAARRIDGGEQFFTRAYDFGFSKSHEETFTKWNKDSILGDMVWVIRNFRPDIIITRFATDGSGGHGHHTASAMLAEEAFDAAADPTRFPEQLKYVGVWKTRRMFHNSTARFFNPNADLSHLIKLDVGGYNPLLGKSYGELAAESRSMHKSQGFGSAKQRGESFEYFKAVKGDTAGLKDIFEGIDFTWKRIKGGEKMGAAIAKIITNYKTESPELSVAALDELYTYIPKSSNDLPYFLPEKIEAISLACLGNYTELVSTQPTISIGDSVIFNGYWTNRSKFYPLMAKRDIMYIDKSPSKGDTLQNVVNYNTTTKITTKLFVKDKEISELYWLAKPIHQNMFDYNTIGKNQSSLWYDKYAFNYMLDGSYEVNKKTRLYYTSEKYKWTDPEKGELYRPLVITPPVMIALQEDIVLFSDNQTKLFTVTLNAGRDSVTCDVNFQAPEGWKVGYLKEQPEEKSGATVLGLKLGKKGSKKALTFWLTPTEKASNGNIQLSVQVDGKEYSKGFKEIKYDHIPVQTLFPEAQAKLVKLDIVKKSRRIGYIPGAGDEVQACLTQLGYEVVTLTDDKLAKENLAQYDAIITGVRAYNTNDKLPSFKQKLMEYVNNGGNLIVQYNTNSWAGPFSSDIGPYKFKITRNRITDEEAKVNFVLPNHPVFNIPNKITEKDFEGWIQERSIYHAGEWDSNYEAPISMTDPYEMTVGNVSPKGKPDNGALIIGKYGKGNFIYTGIVFFRELPAGVPGAYRFMVNLIELGK